MNPLLLKLMSRVYRAPAGDDDGGADGAAEDRGDTLDAGAPATEEPVAVSKDTKAAEQPADGGEDGEEGEGEEHEAGKEHKKDSRIPLSRHKEMLDKVRSERDAVMAQLAKAQQGQQTVVTNERIEATEKKLEGLESEYNKLLADGEIDKATAKMTEIRRLERTVSDQRSDIKAAAAESRAVERVRYDTIVERMESAYPILDPNSDDFDRDVVAEVLDLKDAFELKGDSPSAALQRAAKYVLGADTKKQQHATSVTPNADKESVAKLRKEEAVKRNVDAAKRTPASTVNVGLNNEGGGLTAENAMNMSQEDFAKLDEKALAKLRGDDI